MKLFYSRKQAKLYGYKHFMDNDGRWKRYTEITRDRDSNYSDAVLVYEAQEMPPLKVNIGHDDIYSLVSKAVSYHYRTTNKITYITEMEIKQSLDKLIKQIDKSLIDGNEENFKKLSKKYARIKQML